MREIKTKDRDDILRRKKAERQEGRKKEGREEGRRERGRKGEGGKEERRKEGIKGAKSYQSILTSYYLTNFWKSTFKGKL